MDEATPDRRPLVSEPCRLFLLALLNSRNSIVTRVMTGGRGGTTINLIQQKTARDLNMHNSLVGSMQLRLASGRIRLRMRDDRFSYFETVSGTAVLTIEGVELPDAVCTGLVQDNFRLLDLFDPTAKRLAFLAEANPWVVGLRNTDRSKALRHRPRSVLRIELRMDWSPCDTDMLALFSSSSPDWSDLHVFRHAFADSVARYSLSKAGP